MRSLALLLLLQYRLVAQPNNSDSTQNGAYVVSGQGNILIRGSFKNQKRQGIWTWYEPNGFTQKKIRYKKGKALWTLYYDQNKVWLKINRYGKRRVIRECECKTP